MRNRGDVFSDVESVPLIIEMHEEVSVALLGVLAGAMLVVGVSIVGYWESLDPGVFLQTFGQHASRINSLLLPLTIIAIITTVLTAVATWITRAPNRGWFVAAALLALIVGLLHPLYFMKANATLTAASFASDQVAAFLSSWRNWQWMRVGLCFAALIASIRGLRAADLATITAREARRVSVTVGRPEAPPSRGGVRVVRSRATRASR
jgi:hypothetical protein